MPTLGRYELLRRLARGGMGEVFLARRRSGAGVEKRVVIKRIHPELARDPATVAMFVREARISMALSHQNIVPVFDFGRAGDALFLAMEYVEGRDLAAVLARLRERGAGLDPLLVAFVGAECCAALAYAHGQTFADGTVGVVHRDVTPRNILLSASGEVRLADFGIAVLRHDAVAVIRGTLQYMAPEQAAGAAIDGRADLFALGVVLTEAVNGARARSLDGVEALAQARSGAVPPPGAHVPVALADVLARATAPRADDRFADARTMREALERFIVAARSERADDATPSRALAELLLAELGDAGAVDESPPAPLDAVTFLDHGVEAVLGTATARSIAMTAAEVEAEVEAPAATSAVAALAPAGRRRVGGAIAVAALAATAALAWFALRGGPAAAPAVADGAVAGFDAAPADAAGHDATRADAALPDAAPSPPDGAAPRLPVDAGRPRSTADAGSAAIDTAQVLRRVTISARPWAEFYIDGSATRHETPETVRLTPGPHRVRFVNQPAHVDRTIVLEVPADRDLEHVEVLVAAP